MKTTNPIAELSVKLAIAVVRMVDRVNTPKSSYLTDQIARAGTSVGANVHEAQHAQSRRDFIHKFELALKEANETLYWLRVMFETGRIDEDEYRQVSEICSDLCHLLMASCKTAKDK